MNDCWLPAGLLLPRAQTNGWTRLTLLITDGEHSLDETREVKGFRPMVGCIAGLTSFG
jgi:hypothetical protein